MLKIKVKANAVSNLTDARYFAAREVHWVGFCMDPSAANYVAPAQVKAMCEWLDGVRFVGEFPLLNAAEMIAMASDIGLQAVQTHPFSPLEELAALHTVLEVLPCIPLNENTKAAALEHLLEDQAPYAAAFVLDFFQHGLHWETQPLLRQAIMELSQTYPLLLQAPLSAPILRDVEEKAPRLGLAVFGGEEEQTGIKAFDDLDDVFDLLEENEAFAND